MTDRPDDVTDGLRKDILEGYFSPGERLVELQLCERYRCGRAAVRAALVELDGEGIVSREANRGATVRRVSVEEAVQIVDARAALEGLLAGRAATNADDDERSELRSIIERMRVVVAAGDFKEYSALNALLHRRIREIGRHDVAAELVATLRNRAYHHQYRLSIMPGRPAESLEQHAAIVDAIDAGDADRAVVAMTTHLRSVIDVLEHWGDMNAPPEAAASTGLG